MPDTTAPEVKEDKKSGAPDLQDILDRAEACEDFWNPIYTRGQDDADFALGDGNQWPAKIKKEREKDGRPCLEENRMLPFVNQVVNGIKQNRPSIIPKPVDDKADVQTAEICRGLIRNIETQSDASSVYGTAASNSVMSAVGWIRVATVYAGPDTFDQEARLERVQNFHTVMLDPNHQRQDGSDSRFGFVFTDMDADDFEDEYPDAKTEGYPAKGSWCKGDTIRIGEYFYKEYTEKKLVEYSLPPLADLQVAYEDKMPKGATVTRSRMVQIPVIKHCKFTGAEILEDDNVFPGEYIPLVPIYGFEAFTDGGRTFYSLIHQGKDPQRMLNYWKSASTEIIALQPKTPFVGAVGQFKSYASQWATANIKNYPTLEYDAVTVDDGQGNQLPLPAPQRQQPPTSSGTMMQEAMGAADAIKASLGMYDPSLGNTSNEISGKAIISRQMQGDNATFHFIDNLAVGMRHVGRILIGIIPVIYTGKRTIRILGEDDSESLVPLNQPVKKVGKQFVPDEEGTVINFNAGKYDVVVEVGPSYATKKQELANAIVEIAKVNPDIMAIAGDLFIKALDVPQAEEIAKRIRATMDPALLGDDVEAQRVQKLTEALNAIQQKLQLTEQALLAKKNDDDFKNSLEAKKVENDTTKLKIDAAKTEADIEKIHAEIGKGGSSDEVFGVISSAIKSLKAQSDDTAAALHILLSKAEEEGSGAPPTPDNESTDDAGRSIASAA